MRCPYPVTIRNPRLRDYPGSSLIVQIDGTFLTPDGELLEPSMQVPCGRCVICQNARRDAWAARMELENQGHVCGWFITLTYNEESVPPYLCKADLKNWCKRIRKRIQFRYFACGEYGPQGNRPHFHVIAWFDKLLEQFDIDKLVSDTWKFGFFTCKPVNRDNMRYVAKYTVKSVIETPESYPAPYAVMSRRPGIASNWYDSNCSFFMEFLALEDRRREPIPRYFLEKMDPVEQIQVKRHRREFAERQPKLSDSDMDLRLVNLERRLIRQYNRKYGK